MSEEEIMKAEKEFKEQSEQIIKNKKKKPSPFLKALREKQISQARETLIQTVIERSDDTIGSIFDSLEEDPDGEYIMLDLFKSMTVSDLVLAAADQILGTSDEEEEDELVDTGDYDDDGDEEEEDDNEDDEDEPEPSVKKKNINKKKKAPKKGGTKNKKTSAGASTEYQKKIIACLREGKAKDEDSAMSGADIRAQIGGTDVEFRANMAVLFDLEKVTKFGKARGTKYARVRRKKTE